MRLATLLLLASSQVAQSTNLFETISDDVPTRVDYLQQLHNIDFDYYPTMYEDEMPGKSPDFDLNFQQLVAKNGYSFSQFPVHTEDGYILNVFRITDGSQAKKPAVFLMHGITDSADCWVMQTKDKAAAFKLVDAGFDVWLGNQRGTKHSLTPGHESLDPKSKEFWDFSWTEMGDYDAPAQVDFVRQYTGQDKITWVGHSQGTTQMFYALSNKEDFWAERLNLFVALAPVTSLEHTLNKLLLYISPLGNTLGTILSTIGVYEILGGLSASAAKAVCGLIPQLCQFGEGFIITEDPTLDDTDRFQVYMGHFPAGASVHSMIHYGQMIASKKFQLYDYGKKQNQEKYQSDSPPEVDLTKITGKVPVGMFVGRQDDLGDYIDSEWARDKINQGGNAVKLFQEFPAGHSSFMIGKNMTYVDDMIKLVKQYNH